MKRVYRRFNSGCGLIKHLARGNTPAVWRRFLAPGVFAFYIISKLLRFGEHTAAASLQSLPLAYQRRVRWTLCGTFLTIEADGSRAVCGALNEHGGRGRACLATLLSRRCEWSKEVA